MSLFNYTAFRPDGEIDADSKKSPITKKRPAPLRGHRFAYLQFNGSVNKENLPYLLTFLHYTHGSMLVGGIPLSKLNPGTEEEYNSFSISSERFDRKAYQVVFMIADPSMLGKIADIVRHLIDPEAKPFTYDVISGQRDAPAQPA